MEKKMQPVFPVRQAMLTPVLRIRNTLLSAIDDYFKPAGFCEVAPPILTPFSCEVACVGGSDLISANYYGQNAYLSQSGQLYLESLALQLGKVYCVAPAFRAESTLLATHLAEFWMCEAEMLDVSFDGLVQTANDLLVTIIQAVLKEHSSELTALGSNIPVFEEIITRGFLKITYSHAIDILHGEHVSINWGDDIQPHHELILDKCLNNHPLIITSYPKSLSSFYKAACPENPETTLSFDIIAPHGFRELIGGSLREIDAIKLQDSLQGAGADLQPYDWYIKTISANPTPHGGFGLGIERMVSWLCNLHSIHGAIPFPRTEDILWP
jgi:asparaginyl-tRNA synthetase